MLNSAQPMILVVFSMAAFAVIPVNRADAWQGACHQRFQTSPAITAQSTASEFHSFKRVWSHVAEPQMPARQSCHTLTIHQCLESFATVATRIVTLARQNFPKSDGATNVPKDYYFCARELLLTRCKRSAEPSCLRPLFPRPFSPPVSSKRTEALARSQDSRKRFGQKISGALFNSLVRQSADA